MNGAEGTITVWQEHGPISVEVGALPKHEAVRQLRSAYGRAAVLNVEMVRKGYSFYLTENYVHDVSCPMIQHVFRNRCWVNESTPDCEVEVEYDYLRRNGDYSGDAFDPGRFLKPGETSNRLEGKKRCSACCPDVNPPKRSTLPRKLVSTLAMSDCGRTYQGAVITRIEHTLDGTRIETTEGVSHFSDATERVSLGPKVANGAADAD